MYCLKYFYIKIDTKYAGMVGVEYDFIYFGASKYDFLFYYCDRHAKIMLNSFAVLKL